jgi:hypothetical protein
MQKLARITPISALEDIMRATRVESLATARGILLGAAGFIPLSPIEAGLCGLSTGDVLALEAAWLGWGAPFAESALLPTAWNLARVRPANHPIPRLLAAACLLNAVRSRGGLASAVIAIIGDADPVSAFRALTGIAPTSGIGVDRAIDMIASSIIPFTLALAAALGDAALADAAARQWERLAAPAANEVTRRAARQIAGGAPLGRIGARGAQGLIQLDTVLCQPRRCFECPVAALELSVKGPPRQGQR